ncbi:MAG: hypothetical protein HUU54_00525 [Ignavibacteriaceae bacterium]|nr:hypothetical protein [Ignavibacteriaceae bacterium]
MATQKQNTTTGPKTAFGRYMVYNFIPNYANNVQGLVYMGAALLIIIVGLRGLGTVAYDIPIVPRFLFDEATHKVSPMWVMTSLFLEFALLMVLAIVTFFTPEEAGGHEPAPAAAAPDTKASEAEIAKIKQQIAEFKVIADEEMKALNNYAENIAKVSQKLAAVKADFFKSMSEMKQVFKG